MILREVMGVSYMLSCEPVKTVITGVSFHPGNYLHRPAWNNISHCGKGKIIKVRKLHCHHVQARLLQAPKDLT